jgi:endonuclease G, mitochondrial
MKKLFFVLSFFSLLGFSQENQKIDSVGSENYEKKFDLIDSLIENEEYFLAIQEVNNITSLDPKNIRAYEYEGDIYSKWKKYHKSLESYNKILSIDSMRANIYNKIGIVYHFYLNDLEKGLLNYNKAISIDPLYFAPYSNRADLYVKRENKRGKTEDYKDAILSYTKAIDLDTTNNPELYIKRARCYTVRPNLIDNQYNLAVNDYNSAISIRNDYYYYYYLRAFTKSKYLLKYESAIKDFKTSIELDSTYYYNYRDIAYAYRKLGKTELALTTIDKAIDNLDNSYKKEAFLHNLKGKIYQFDLSNYEDALLSYQLSIMTDSTYIRSYINRIGIYERSGDIDKAISDLNTLISIDTNMYGVPGSFGYNTTKMYSDRIDYLRNQEKPLKNYELYMPSSTDNLVVHKSFYSLSYLKNKKLSEWTIYFATKNNTLGAVRRSDNFRPDNFLPTDLQSYSGDYRGSGYDRGHLVPAGDMSFSSIAMSESFLYSNMAPQTPSFNRGIWRNLEALVREFTDQHDSLIIITGCIFKDTTHFEEVTVGRNVPVPEFYYKIVVDIERLSSIAFVIPNTKTENNLETYVYSIREVEKLTGIDFLTGLHKSIQNLIEKEYRLEDWQTEVNFLPQRKFPVRCIKSKIKEDVEINQLLKGYVRCHGTTQKGNKCYNNTKIPKGYCYLHVEQFNKLETINCQFYTNNISSICSYHIDNKDILKENTSMLNINEGSVIYDDSVINLFSEGINFFPKSNKNKELTKMAFVIGNSNYYRESEKLKNPKNDANLIYKTFIEIEFDTVILLQDLNHEKMENAMIEFQDLSYNYDISIFYYAGHGVQDPNGNSYLIPINYKGDSLENIAISLREFIYLLSSHEKNNNIVILDACRQDYDNRSMSKPDIEDPVNLKLGFSTSFGKKAFDHPELDNSLYTSYLSENLLKPNMKLIDVFHSTWTKVFNSTHHEQSPTEYFGQQLEHLILLPK